MNPLKLTAFSLLAISFLFPFENAFAQKGSVKDKLVDAPYTAVEWPSFTGEKVGVAVLSFEDGLSGKAEANWFNADSGIQVNFGLGDGLSNMLVSTLISTNRFKIIDKKIARRVFDLYSNDTATKLYAAAPALPKVPGVKYFILGSLTAFDDGASGVEGGIGIGGVKLSGGKSTASLTIHMRIIDATNGQVVYSAPVEGTASVSKGGISIDGVGGLSGFKAAPIGQAIQKMLDKATDSIIVKSFPGTPSIFPPITEDGASK
jgi:curli biogenesis system outer membrane secretion channel CsgG